MLSQLGLSGCMLQCKTKYMRIISTCHSLLFSILCSKHTRTFIHSFIWHSHSQNNTQWVNNFKVPNCLDDSTISNELQILSFSWHSFILHLASAPSCWRQQAKASFGWCFQRKKEAKQQMSLPDKIIVSTNKFDHHALSEQFQWCSMHLLFKAIKTVRNFLVCSQTHHHATRDDLILKKRPFGLSRRIACILKFAKLEIWAHAAFVSHLYFYLNLFASSFLFAKSL